MAKSKTKYEKDIVVYSKDEPVTFNGTSDWVAKTGNSGAIIRDMIDGKVQSYKDWEYRA